MPDYLLISSKKKILRSPVKSRILRIFHSRGREDRTPINGFGDRRTTIVLFPWISGSGGYWKFFLQAPHRRNLLYYKQVQIIKCIFHLFLFSCFSLLFCLIFVLSISVFHLYLSVPYPPWAADPHRCRPQLLYTQTFISRFRRKMSKSGSGHVRHLTAKSCPAHYTSSTLERYSMEAISSFCMIKQSFISPFAYTIILPSSLPLPYTS